MSLPNDVRLFDRRSSYTMVNPTVALAMVLRSRPSTPAIEEARRISLERQATGAVPRSPQSASAFASRELTGSRPDERRTSELARQRDRSQQQRVARDRSGREASRPGFDGPLRAASSGGVSGRRDSRSPAQSGSPELIPFPRRATASAGDRQVRTPQRPTTSARPAPGRTGAPVSQRPTPPPAPTRGAGQRLVVTSDPGSIVAARGPVPTPTNATPAATSGAATPGAYGATAAARQPEFREVEADQTAVLRRSRLSSVPEKSGSRPIAAITGTVSGAILLVVAFTSVGLHAKLAKNQVVLDQIRSEVSVQERANQRLRVEVAELQAPQRIVAEATRMGMELSTDVEFLDASALSGSTAVTVPPSGSASGR